MTYNWAKMGFANIAKMQQKKIDPKFGPGMSGMCGMCPRKESRRFFW